ncbi:uncharacterized protein EI90DRAFT_1344477 [Cantharellus anzutake]|uniref:uncharacterized protein n=1 Tax=Cantharellus anzutake TaxID=1750568 RepID=UPI0019085A89|nr:uncharacterized protein EI90DRAFT_1344477 [Cantharellus anzutake]KAF8329783.1 hypothetical protein EI90DRAFT_1344477 [Cantharellus anzutake]
MASLPHASMHEQDTNSQRGHFIHLSANRDTHPRKHRLPQSTRKNRVIEHQHNHGYTAANHATWGAAHLTIIGMVNPSPTPQNCIHFEVFEQSSGSEELDRICECAVRPVLQSCIARHRPNLTPPTRGRLSKFLREFPVISAVGRWELISSILAPHPLWDLLPILGVQRKFRDLGWATL